MKKILVLSLVLVFVYCSNPEDKSSNNHQKESSSTEESEQEKAVATDDKMGEELYQQMCVACHGQGGDSQIAGATNLKTSTISYEEKLDVVTNGRNAMAGAGPSLLPIQLEAVTQYAHELKEE